LYVTNENVKKMLAAENKPHKQTYINFDNKHSEFDPPCDSMQFIPINDSCYAQTYYFHVLNKSELKQYIPSALGVIFSDGLTINPMRKYTDYVAKKSAERIFNRIDTDQKMLAPCYMPKKHSDPKKADNRYLTTVPAKCLSSHDITKLANNVDDWHNDPGIFISGAFICNYTDKWPQWISMCNLQKLRNDRTISLTWDSISKCYQIFEGPDSAYFMSRLPLNRWPNHGPLWHR
jgi:hypothetical protein